MRAVENMEYLLSPVFRRAKGMARLRAGIQQMTGKKRAVRKVWGACVVAAALGETRVLGEVLVASDGFQWCLFVLVLICADILV